jgi:hypothetical protein
VAFSAVERRLSLYLRALWDLDVELRPVLHASGPARGRRATLDRRLIRLPWSCAGCAGQTGLDLFRAAAVHAAAHVLHTSQRFPVDELKPLQVALISLIEDARVEHLAMRQFPGLKAVWAPFHVARPGGAASSVSLMSRLARALIDEDYEDDDPWVRRARRLFFEQRDYWEDQSISRTLGGLLGKELRQRDQFDFRAYLVEPAYRDDNLGIWDFANQGQPGEEDGTVHQSAKARRCEQGQPEDQDTAGDAQAGSVQGVKQAAALQRDAADDTLKAPTRYDEWDYVIGRERPGWCTLFEKPAAHGDAREIDQVLERNHDLVNRVKHLVRAVQVQRPIRLKRRLDGDRLDLDASISALIDLRSRIPPDPRLHSLLSRHQRDLSVLVLLDLSQSTNDVVRGTETTVLQLAREATALLADAMERIGDSFAIHGFSSNGRHDVGYFRFKDFDRAYGDTAKSRLAGMTSQLSTRMGTALRHAGSYLKDRRTHRKLVLLVTDGEPSDIDVHDSQYLVLDARKAVEENQRNGIYTYCMSLDPKADRYVSRIFGLRNWMVVDHLRRLPETLPLLYMRLTH